jgi:hypothetical protein
MAGQVAEGGLIAGDYGHDRYSDHEHLRIEIDLHAVTHHEYL